MNKRILIVGGVAGGASVAARVPLMGMQMSLCSTRDRMFPFPNCALPYHLSGIVENSQDLVLMSGKIQKQYNIEARVNSEVVRIDRDSKKVTVRDLTNGEEYEEAYDKLVLSPGASQIHPRNIDGIDRQHVFTVRNVVDIERISKYIQKWDIQDVAVTVGDSSVWKWLRICAWRGEMSACQAAFDAYYDGLGASLVNFVERLGIQPAHEVLTNAAEYLPYIDAAMRTIVIRDESVGNG